MPRFLKLDTQRRLTACQASLTLAFALLSRPKTLSYEQISSDGAVEVGLIGVAADLAVSACLYEVLGNEGIVRKESGFYLTASEAVDNFRSMLATTIPRLTSLTEGLGKPTEHLERLRIGTETFKVLASARAAAVHGGAGTSYEVAFYAGKTVSDFLILLSQSTKWRPYLRDVPLIPTLPKERTLLAQELQAAALAGDGAALISIFLVLPELSSTEPEWLTSLEHVRVTPNAHDISILIKTLQHANIGDLHKVGKGSSAIPTIFASGPGSLPIYTAGYKKQFDNPADSWQASIGIANSALQQGRLDLPNIGAVYNFAAMGVDRIGLTAEEVLGGLSAHSLWPFIAASLDYSGTRGPCFFLIRALKQGEHGQLLAFLKKARLKSVKIKSEFQNYEPLFAAVFEGRLASDKLPIAEPLRASVQLGLSSSLAMMLARDSMSSFSEAAFSKSRRIATFSATRCAEFPLHPNDYEGIPQPAFCGNDAAFPRCTGDTPHLRALGRSFLQRVSPSSILRNVAHRPANHPSASCSHRACSSLEPVSRGVGIQFDKLSVRKSGDPLSWQIQPAEKHCSAEHQSNA